AAPGPRPATAGATATPSVRKLARDLGVDIESVAGSGPGGRVTEDDVRGAHAGKRGEPSAPKAPPAERRPLRGKRRMIAKKMVAAKTRVPHVLLVDEAEATAIRELRAKAREAGEREGVKVTVLPFIIKAVVAALKEHPVLNASLDEEREEMVLKKSYDIGVAVDTEDGPMVPVVRNADTLSILDMAREIHRLANAARAGSIAPGDLSGGTFTVTSIGSIGGLLSYPIINVPEAAILAAHKIVSRPVARDGKVVPRDMMYLSLSFDHRIVDGGEAARFLNDVIRRIETPEG
ncbi:MAG: dihydrolipoamide acetyltransferase family protein, partial [Thermodesulfobacteriota bacterium]